MNSDHVSSLEIIQIIRILDEVTIVVYLPSSQANSIVASVYYTTLQLGDVKMLPHPHAGTPRNKSIFRPGIVREQCSQKIFIIVRKVSWKIMRQKVGISELDVEGCGFINRM